MIYFSFSQEQIQAFQQVADVHGGHKSFNAQSEAEAITFMMEETEVLLGLFLKIINRDVRVTNMAGLVVFPAARASLVENLANVCYRANRGNTGIIGLSGFGLENAQESEWL